MELHGWAAFRQAEYDVIKLGALDGLIVDGGGASWWTSTTTATRCSAIARSAWLRAGGSIVFLRGDIDRLAAKVQGDPSRPTLDARRSAGALMRARMPFYEAAADWIIDVEGRQRSGIAEEIAKALFVNRGAFSIR